MYLLALYNSQLFAIGESVQFNNLYINSIWMFILKRKMLMCVKCEKNSYVNYNCFNLKLLRKEQSVLKDIMFKGKKCLLYWLIIILSASVMLATAASSVALTTAEVHLIMYNFTSLLKLSPISRNLKSAEIFIKKKFELNKWAHIKKMADSLILSVAFQLTAAFTA